MDNAIYNTHKVKQVCENKLGIQFRDGKEFNGWVLLDGKKAARLTVAKGRKPVPPKTYRGMARQLHLTAEEFDGLLGCSLVQDAYQSLLKERKNTSR